jgi:hypothetical protein
MAVKSGRMAGQAGPVTVLPCGSDVCSIARGGRDGQST